VTSTFLQQYIARHCTGTRYEFQFVLLHRTDVHTWVRRYCNIHKGADAYYTTTTSRYVQVRTANLTSQMTRLSEFYDADGAAS
jgi:hypothetical protein